MGTYRLSRTALIQDLPYPIGYLAWATSTQLPHMNAQGLTNAAPHVHMSVTKAVFHMPHLVLDCPPHKLSSGVLLRIIPCMNVTQPFPGYLEAVEALLPHNLLVLTVG